MVTLFKKEAFLSLIIIQLMKASRTQCHRFKHSEMIGILVTFFLIQFAVQDGILGGDDLHHFPFIASAFRLKESFQFLDLVPVNLYALLPGQRNDLFNQPVKTG